MRAIVLSISIVLSTIAAASADPFRDCDNGSVSACTYVIENNAEPQSKAVAFYSRGLHLLAAKDADGAIRDFTHAIEIRPDDAEAYHNRGVSHYAKRQYDRAIADFSKAIQLKPRFALSLANRGLAYQSKGDYARAIADYSSALAINPRERNAAEKLREAQAALDKQILKTGAPKLAAPTFATKTEPSSAKPKNQGVTAKTVAGQAILKSAISLSRRGLTVEVVPNTRNVGGEDVPVAITRDGRFLVTSSGPDLVLWHVETGHTLRRIRGHESDVLFVSFAANDRIIVSASKDGSVKVWDTSTGGFIRALEREIERITGLAVSPDGKSVVTSSTLDAIQIWDLETGRKTRTLHASVPDEVGKPFASFILGRARSQSMGVELGERVHSIALSPDGKYIASGSPAGNNYGGSPKYMVVLWDAATGKVLRKFGQQDGLISALSFSRDSRYLLSGGGGNGHEIGTEDADNSVRLWDITTGNLVKKFDNPGGTIRSLAISPDGKHFVAGVGEVLQVGRPKPIQLWDMQSGTRLLGLDGVTGGAGPLSVGFTSDGKAMFFGGAEILLIDPNTGKTIRTFGNGSSYVKNVFFRPGTAELLSVGLGQNPIRLWDMERGAIVRSFEAGEHGGIENATLSDDGSLLAVSNRDGSFIIWNVVTGKLQAQFKDESEANFDNKQDNTSNLSRWAEERRERKNRRTNVAQPSQQTAKKVVGGNLHFLPGGKSIIACALAEPIKLWDIERGKLIRTLEGDPFCRGEALIVTPDGRRVIGGAAGHIWDLETGKIVGELEHLRIGIEVIDSARTALALSADGKTVIAGSAYGHGILTLFDATSGKAIRSYSDHSVERRVHTRENFTECKQVPVAHDSSISIVAFSPDGQKIYSSGSDRFIKVWDVFTGRLLKTFDGDQAYRLTIQKSGLIAASNGPDGAIKLWRTDDGQRIASSLVGADGANLTITPQGFFTSAGKETKLLSIARGLELTLIDQVHQSLFNPDLVREALAGDPNREVEGAAKVVNLDNVLDSGPAPLVEIIQQSSINRVGKGTLLNTSRPDLFIATARITDRGKGIGRIEWRVNGITAAVSNAPANAGPVYDVRQELALEPGENAIEVIAYNARNLLASLPAQTTIPYNGPADATKPKLYVLAVGINQYQDHGWVSPEGKRTRFQPLSLAEDDARAIGEELKRAGEGLYKEVRVTPVIGPEATAANLERIVTDMAPAIHPRDTFVFFVAGHGYSHQGRFYLIPPDYDGGVNPEALKSRGIGQDKLQDWIANRIKAKKALILLDTCESGALTSGYSRSRVAEPASDASIGRLHEATGRPILTAAAQGQNAFEFRNIKHGIFTGALIDALYHAQANQDGIITLSALVAHVQDLVPKLAKDPKAREALLARGQPGGSQSARFGSKGEDFALFRRLQ